MKIYINHKKNSLKSSRKLSKFKTRSSKLRNKPINITKRKRMLSMTLRRLSNCWKMKRRERLSSKRTLMILKKRKNNNWHMNMNWNNMPRNSKKRLCTCNKNRRRESMSLRKRRAEDKKKKLPI